MLRRPYRALAVCSAWVFACTLVQSEEPRPLHAIEKAVVLLSHTEPKADYAIGSGFMVGADGRILTANHVIIDEKSGHPHERLFAIHFTGDQHRFFRVTVAHRCQNGSQGRDLTLLRPVASPDLALPHLQIGSIPEVGAEVLLAGFPLVFDKFYPFPLVRRGSVASSRFTFEGDPVLVLDLAAVFGFSGSPVVDLKTGKAIAVFIGSPSERTNTNFSVAAVIQPTDVEAEKQESQPGKITKVEAVPKEHAR